MQNQGLQRILIRRLPIVKSRRRVLSDDNPSLKFPSDLRVDRVESGREHNARQ